MAFVMIQIANVLENVDKFAKDFLNRIPVKAVIDHHCI